MPDLQSVDLKFITYHDTPDSFLDIRTSLHYVVQIHYDTQSELKEPPYVLLALSLRYNEPFCARESLEQLHVTADMIDRFMALYETDYRIFHSDITQPRVYSPRFIALTATPGAVPPNS